jgi:hypothetical protein
VIGETVQFTVSAREKDCLLTPVRNRPVTITFAAPGVPSQTLSGQTGNDGKVAIDLAVGNQIGIAQFTANMQGARKSASATKYVSVNRDAGDLRFDYATPRITPMLSYPICVILAHNSVPLSGRRIRLVGVGATVDQQEVITDASGRGCTTFYAHDAVNFPTVQAMFDGLLPGNPTPVTLIADRMFLVNSGGTINVSANPRNVQGSGLARVVATLAVDGQQVAGLPVQFTLQGNGALSATSGQTDSLGEVAVQFVSPGANTTGSSVVQGE